MKLDQSLMIVLFTAGAGLAIPAGGALALWKQLHPSWLDRELRHGIMAFGGGVLFAAVALVLVPEGTRLLPAVPAVLALLAGGASLLFIDRALQQRGTPASMLVAALLDFAPEAIALGAVASSRPQLAPLLAALIALQNVPEGFNAYRELVMRRQSSQRRVLWLFLALVPLGPACGLLGLYSLSHAPMVTGVIMMFASGGILYLVFQDIAPQAHLERHWGPPLGAVLGFSVGLAGQLLIGP